MTRIVVFAYSLVGHSCLKALIHLKENIVGVVTHPDPTEEPQWFPSVGQLAKDHHIPVIITEDAKDAKVYETVKNLQPDLLFSFYYRKMIPETILQLPRLGCFNMHGSLLPRYRGRAPINWVLVHGETQTGATLHHMVKSADAGAIVDQEAFSIDPTDNAFDLTHKMGEAAVHVLVRQLAALKEGSAPSILQDDSKATYFGGRSAKDSQIDWNQTSWQIHNLIRAVPFPYFPAAFTFWKKQQLEVRANQIPTDIRLKEAAKPGQVVAKGNERLRVACGDGKEYLDITTLSKPITDFEIGDILGT